MSEESAKTKASEKYKAAEAKAEQQYEANKTKAMQTYDALEERLDDAEQALDGLEERIEAARDLLDAMQEGAEETQQLKELGATAKALKEQAEGTAANVAQLMGDLFYAAHATTQGLPIKDELAATIAQYVSDKITAEAHEMQAQHQRDTYRPVCLRIAWILALIVAVFFAASALTGSGINMWLVLLACVAAPLLFSAWAYQAPRCAIAGILCCIAGICVLPVGGTLLIPQIVFAIIGLVRLRRVRR